jgi:cytochrome P450
MSNSVQPEVPVVDEFDPLSMDFVRDPYPVLNDLRERYPVFYLPDLELYGITRWEDQAQLFGDWKTYSSRCVGVGPRPEEMKQRLHPEYLNETFNALDPPAHSTDRKLASQAFRRARVNAMGEVTTRIANELIDGFEGEGRCDLMARYCFPLSMQVMVDLLGFPADDTALLDGWGNDLTVLFIPKQFDAPDDVMVKPMDDDEWLVRWTRLAEAREYFEGLIEQRIDEPSDDLISTMVHARLEDGTTALDREHVVTHLVEFISAGKAAMADLMAQTALVFREQPEVLEELRRSPDRWEDVVEEALRLRGNALGLLRVATSEVEIGGHTIPKGARLWLLAASANHDERHFACPAKFDLDRQNAGDHLAFGRGIHKCIGSPLARVVCTEGLKVLYERLPDLRPIPESAVFQPSLLAFLMRSLEVEW